MFKKKDYLEYFHQLYVVEMNMKKEAEGLAKLIDTPQIKKLLQGIIADEVRHAKIVKSMIDLI